MLASRRAALVLALFALTASCGDGGGGSGGSTTSTASTGGSGGATTSTGASGGSGGSTTATGATGGSTTGTGGAGGATTGTGGATSSGGATTGTGGAMFDYYGALSGCDAINLAELQSPNPLVVDNLLDFTGEPAFDAMYLTPGGQANYASGNLNASSLKSECIAYDALFRCNGALFLKGEADILYDIDGKKTDLLVEIDGVKVGVSVVRAESFPKGSPYPVSQAFTVLDGKLSDILQSTVNVSPQDAWVKQILTVVAQTPEHAAAIVEAYGMVSEVNKGDTIVVITVTEGDDDFIYYN